MYIQPNTNVRLLRNCPCDSDYVNTILFTNANTQASYFMGLTKYSLTAQSYQRVSKGIFRVNYKYESLYDCNYMMFQNESFGTKWFYAFIDSIDYVNDVTSEIHFTIDVMQTWMTEFSINSCFVEREHSNTDEIGDNILPEPVECGEYVYNNYSYLTKQDGTEIDFKDLVLLIGIVDTEASESKGSFYDNIYGGEALWAYHMLSNTVDKIDSKISEYIQKPDAINSMYVIPREFVSYISTSLLNNGIQLTSSTEASTIYAKGKQLTENDELDGYTPFNKKLYTYPYNFFNVDNGNASALAIRYEFCKNLTPNFTIYNTIRQPVKSSLRPSGYKGVNETVRTETLELDNFPLCSWNYDTYKAWVAQNNVPLMAKYVGSTIDIAVSEIGSLMSQGPILGTAETISNAYNQISGLLLQNYTASIQADICKGSINNGNVNVSNFQQNYKGGRLSVTSQYAKLIDEFLSRYGYATNRIKIPLRASRAKWNYVKTRGCTISGSIPADDEKLICAIHDRGITYWHDTEHVGKYLEYMRQNTITTVSVN